MFTDDSEYDYYEALVFKLIFTTYNEEKMVEHYLLGPQLLAEWELIDQVRQRKKRNMKT
jgi:hypothetical protein